MGAIITWTIAAIFSLGIYFLIFRYVYRILKKKFNLKLNTYLIILVSILLIVVCVCTFPKQDRGDILPLIIFLPIMPIVFLSLIFSGGHA